MVPPHLSLRILKNVKSTTSVTQILNKKMETPCNDTLNDLKKRKLLTAADCMFWNFKYHQHTDVKNDADWAADGD